MPPSVAGQQRRVAGGPCRVLAERDQQAAPSIDEPLQRAARRRGRKRRVVEDDDRALFEAGRRHPRRRGHLDLKRRRIADRERFRQIQGRVASLPARVTGCDDQHRHRTARREHEIEDVVLRQQVGSRPHGAAHVRVGERERRERHRPGAVRRRRSTGFDSIGWPSTSSVVVRPLTAAAPRLTRPAVTVMRSCPEKLARAKASDGIDTFDVSALATDTGVTIVPSGNRISSAPVHPVFWKSLTSTTSFRLSDDAPRMLCASLSAGPYRVEPDVTLAASTAWPSRRRSLVARTFSSAFLANSTSVALSSPPSPSIGLAGRLACALPVIAVAHAGRLIEQHDDLARAARRGHRQRALRDERPRERGDDQQDAPPPAAAAGASGGCCGAAPTDTGSAGGTSATETRRPACARAGSGGSGSESPARRGRRETRGSRKLTAPSSVARGSRDS